MRLRLLVYVLALGLAPLPVWAAGSRDSAAQSAAEDIRQLVREWDDAIRQRNVRALGRILADGFTMTDASGAVLTKADYLTSIVKAANLGLITSFASEVVAVTVDGDTAVVTGRSPVKGRPRGGAQALPANYLFTDRWVNVDGVWKAVATKATKDR